MISLLAAEKLPGYETHDQLVRDILDSGVIEQFTRMIRPGLIGPITLAGLYMPGVLEKKNDKLVLSKNALYQLQEMRKEYVGHAAAQWALYRESDGTTQRPDMLGLVCPAAAPKGALTTAKAAFMAFYSEQ